MKRNTLKRNTLCPASSPLCRLMLFICLVSGGYGEAVLAQQASASSQTPKQTVTFTAPPIFPATTPETRRLILEDSYFFNVRTFTPAVKVKYVTRATASNRTPEDAAIAHISALAAQDFAWFRSGWTAQAQAVLDEQDKLHNQTPQFWTNLWQKVFANRQIELTHRIETGDYVLIAYRILGAGTDGKDIEMLDTLKKDKDQWLSTQELSGDPIFSFWRKTETPVKRVIRMAPGVTIESAPRQ